MKSTRADSTLAGLICLKEGVQHQLPQVFIPNWGKLTRREQQVYQNGLQPPIEVWRGFNGWVNDDAMKQLITCYRSAVRNIDPTATLVLLMDAASQHLSKAVLMHARRLNVMLVMIPGKLTYLLQPLDVSVFRALKDSIKQNLLKVRMTHPQGIIPLEERVAALNDSIFSTLTDKDWTSAFAKVGATGELASLRQSILHYFPQGIEVPSIALNDDELEEVAGRHRLELGAAFNTVVERLVARSIADSQNPPIEDEESQATLAIEESSAPQPRPVRAIPLPPRNPHMSVPHHRRNVQVSHSDALDGIEDSD
jgi:hypothetical protein